MVTATTPRPREDPVTDFGIRKHARFYGMTLQGAAPLWSQLLACDDRVSDRVRRVFIRFDAVHQHTTYYRTFEDVLVENEQYITTDILHALNRRGAASLDRGVWLGAFYKGTKCMHNGITLALIEHVFPVSELPEEKTTKTSPVFSAERLDHPIDFGEVAETPFIRSSVWPVGQFVAEYLGVQKTRIRAMSALNTSTVTKLFAHVSGKFLFQFEVHRCRADACLPLIRAGSWEFWTPHGDAVESYWGANYDPETTYAGLGRPKYTTAQKQNIQTRHNRERHKLLEALGMGPREKK